MWDPAGRLTEQALTGPTAGSVQRRTYTYRADGYVTAIDDQLSGRRTFDLDAAGRVTAVQASDWTERYAYDEAGNQTHAGWPSAHPAQEATGTRAYTGTRITRAGNIRYEHDDAGRLTLRQKTRLSKKPDTWRYTWDAEDRLTAVTTPDGTVWRYLYDPFGRRIAKQRLARDGETIAEQVDFTWDGPTLVEQTATTSDLPYPVTLTWDHAGLHPVAQTERITEATTQRDRPALLRHRHRPGRYPHRTRRRDRRHSLANPLYPLGHHHLGQGQHHLHPLRFPGQYYDPETGLHYNHHRYYDPTTARYLTPDPLGLLPAPNPATYIHNPHTWTDPLGLSPYPKSKIGKFFDKLFKSKEELQEEELRAKRVPMRLGDLERYGLPDHGDKVKIRDMRGMHDERLLEAINNPDVRGSVIVLKDGEVEQGNHRIAEALERMKSPRHKDFHPDTEIWVVP